MPEKWRSIFIPDASTADMLAYPSALIEGRIAGKYMLSGEALPNTAVVLGYQRNGILAGAEVDINKDAAAKNNIDVAIMARSGRGGPKPVDTIGLQDLLKESSRKFKAVEADPDDPAVLLYTSGTTGKPKGVTLTHRNFATQCDNAAQILPMSDKDRMVLVLPLYHVYGLANGLVTSVSMGSTMVIIPQYTPSVLLETIARTKATMLIAVPTMYMHLLQIAKVRKTAIPQSLHTCISGGAPLAAATLQEFEDAFDTVIAEGYGLTETTSAVCLNKSGEDYKPGAIGIPAPGIEMKVVDDDGNEVPDGTEGEIIIRGGVLTPGYWNDTASTAESIRNGWLHTGDLGYRDHDGVFFITDRKKDLIIRGGFNISPREIEEVLYGHPGIHEAAVAAVHDKRDREMVKAFVVPAEGVSLTEQQVLDYCRANLADYKTPKRVEFMEALPKSATGKVLRKELRGEAVDDRLIHREQKE
ncbi:AMP-binding protein [Spirochaeta africana]|uniref:Acyl-CoA synthetase (AMP-forming)/AMP-acid ligase II n=1 Tax=Spirochaeta africana (strain ATCC 700263 / DSM 8902 / Z-7692) TaxID=889378 RepID=H9UIN5_SPIAZ|nr:AMP-binding protein [Spirochaeta africana]AFG37378.1 acyl-CoA synthetase (AMP-forming)/AMP-acid ligase II [Spirochaeta africana DSM 8902]